MINLFWWRGGPGFGNFGDELARTLVAHFSGQTVRWSELSGADMVAVGSLLEPHFADPFRWSDFSGAVWGTGKMEGKGKIDLSNADVTALRGVQTKSHVELATGSDVALGDPGILAERLVSARPGKKVGIVPHWSQRNHRLFRSNLGSHPDVKIIDVCQPVRQVLKDIANCRAILSTSLHALVIADSLRIPNAWLSSSALTTGDVRFAAFKLADYASPFAGKQVTHILIDENSSLPEILDQVPAVDEAGIEATQQKLLDAFPFPKKSTRRNRHVPQKTSRQSVKSEDVSLKSIPCTPRDPYDDSPARCVVLVPYHHQIVPACDEALRELERRGYPVRRVPGYAAIDQARNRLSTAALQDGYQETMWIDADIGFRPEDVDRLRHHHLPISCGIYAQKGRRALACHHLPTTEKIHFGRRGGLTEIMYAATGFLHVRREVYESVQQKFSLPMCNRQFGQEMIPFFLPMVRETEAGSWYLAEDYAFSHRVLGSGYKIMADTTIRLRHFGMHGYGWEEAGLPRPSYDSFEYYLRSPRNRENDTSEVSQEKRVAACSP